MMRPGAPPRPAPAQVRPWNTRSRICTSDERHRAGVGGGTGGSLRGRTKPEATVDDAASAGAGPTTARGGGCGPSPLGGRLVGARRTCRYGGLVRWMGAGVLACALLVGAGGGGGAAAHAAGLTAEQAVAVALQRNRDVIAARLEIEGSELDVVAARLYPNPTLGYAIGNLLLGKANLQNPVPTSSFADQPVQTVGVSEIVDVWMKRSAHIRAAEKGVERRRLLTEDALREIVYSVRSGFAEAVREQEERQMAREFADRYAQTIKISQARFKAGDISEADLRKIELEGLRYQNAVIDAEMQLDVARSRLAALLGLPVGALPPALAAPADAAARPSFDLAPLTARAVERRPGRLGRARRVA
jgi:outer membrane protein TolC